MMGWTIKIEPIRSTWCCICSNILPVDNDYPVCRECFEAGIAYQEAKRRRRDILLAMSVESNQVGKGSEPSGSGKGQDGHRCWTMGAKGGQAAEEDPVELVPSTATSSIQVMEAEIDEAVATPIAEPTPTLVSITY